MNPHGTLITQVYTSLAQLPVAGATIAITQPSKNSRHHLVALRVTDKNGKISPVVLPTPPMRQSLSPDATDAQPFAQYDLWVQATGYEVALIQDVQVFPSTETIQKVELIPLPEYTPLRSRGEMFQIPPQNL